MTTISTSKLATIVGEPVTKLGVWQNRGIIRSGTDWFASEALSVGLYARLRQRGVATADAATSAVRMCEKIDQLLNFMFANPETFLLRCDAIMFIAGEGTDGDPIEEFAWSEQDAAETLAKLLVKRFRWVSVLNVSDLIVSLCAAFKEASALADAKAKARTEAKIKVLA